MEASVKHEGNVTISNSLDDRKGFSHKTVYFCKKCKSASHKYTSPFNTFEKIYGYKPSEINVRKTVCKMGRKKRDKIYKLESCT